MVRYACEGLGDQWTGSVPMSPSRRFLHALHCNWSEKWGPGFVVDSGQNWGWPGAGNLKEQVVQTLDYVISGRLPPPRTPNFVPMVDRILKTKA